MMGLKLNKLVYGQNAFRYHIVPVVFVIGFTLGVQVFMVWTQGESAGVKSVLDNILGDATSWAITIAFFLWAWYFIWKSSSVYLGPETTFGYRPRYANNGFLYFTITMAAYLALHLVFPGTSLIIWTKFPKIIAVSNILALALCAWLYVKGKYMREHEGDIAEPAPIPYEYYRGMELHPHVFGADVKQWTNCRVGMMSWALFLTAMFIAYTQIHGYSAAYFMHCLLQLVYIGKFFWWESGYFNTLDMMVDRAGYYLCWGCLVFLPAFFCFPAAYAIIYPPDMSDRVAYFIGGAGLLLTYFEYTIDQQRHNFRRKWQDKFIIWGKPAKYVLGQYVDNKGQKKMSPLLTSGYWGIARHLNYTVEIVISFAISATLGFNHGIITFGYFLFITPLLFHRILRDEAKCSAKYGVSWKQYKNAVPYILIPGLY